MTIAGCPVGAPPVSEAKAVEDKGFFGSLFDFSFESFITTKLVPVLYGLALVAVVLTAIGLFTRGGAGILLGLIVLAFGTIYARVMMETIIVFFRIAEHTRDMAAALVGKTPTPPTTGSPAADE
jgi:Domain of unknown function (DUF4282)